MRFLNPRLAAFSLGLFLTALVPAAYAQIGSGMGPGGSSLGEDRSKPEGVAEKAPKEEGQQPTTPVLPPWPGYETKKLSLFSLDGYLRVRSDWFKKLHLGFRDTGEGIPFRRPTSCGEQPGEDDIISPAACEDSIGSANMRLRLEPKIHMSEDVVVISQIDLLDNLVLGATPARGPYGEGQSLDVLEDGQLPPEQGRNYAIDSIRVKRAWAEVQTPLGLLKFGRMPSHWAMGINQNSGDYNPYTGVTCYDCDWGDTVDRISFERGIPGTSLRVTIAKDWPNTGPTSADEEPYRQPIDLDDADDMKQWVFVLGQIDDARTWNEKAESGDFSLNYGAWLAKRDQDFVGFDDENGQLRYTNRDAHLWVPDVFVRIAWKKLRASLEAVGVFGDVEDAMDVSAGLEDQTVTMFGAVGKVGVSLLDGDLDFDLEVGFASGDQWDAEPQGSLDIDNGRLAPIGEGDDTLSAFVFDRNYHVDLILFRELMGAVHNATYFKPKVSYRFSDRFGFDLAAIVSFANRPVATPGNARMYGVELNGDIGYRNEDEGFFAGVSYGVLFPLSALDQPSNLGFGDAQSGQEHDPDADNAQTLQTRLIIAF